VLKPISKKMKEQIVSKVVFFITSSDNKGPTEIPRLGDKSHHIQITTHYVLVSSSGRNRVVEGSK